MITRRLFTRAALAAAAIVATALPGRAEEPLEVRAIYTVPTEQQWVSRIHLALNAAQERGDINYEFSENVANADYERVMREYAEGGADLVVGESFAVERAARDVAGDYPDVKFLMGSSGQPQEPNFAVFDNYIQEPAFLTGMIAGAETDSNKIGMVGGYAIPEVNRLMNAFMAGAREVNPDVTFQVTFIDSWYDPPKAKEAAFAMIDGGADVMYAERFGVSDAAKERGIKAIGNVIDTAGDYPGTILASAIWHMEPTIDAAIEAVRAGEFAAEDYGKLSHMPVGGSSLVYDEALVPEEVAARVEERKSAIMDGSFAVEIDDEAPQSD